MSFLIENNVIKEVSLCTPQARVPGKYTGITVGTFKLNLYQTATFSVFNIHFVRFATMGGIGKINSGLPTLFIGVYLTNSLTIIGPEARPISYVGIDYPGFRSLNRQDNVCLRTPGIYSLIVVNNSGSAAIDAIVTANVKITT